MKNLNQFVLIIVFVALVSCYTKKGTAVPNRLTVNESFKYPNGYYNNSQVFSWKLPVDVKTQSAYSVVVASSAELLSGKANLWQSGKVESNQTLLVKYEGANSHLNKKYTGKSVWGRRFGG